MYNIIDFMLGCDKLEISKLFRQDKHAKKLPVAVLEWELQNASNNGRSERWCLLS